ncbi:glycoside hydrolase family 12 protein [Xylaria telfairii]|nr:glycoside hydrolase family 12 protein [Xylaria telfairii]
MLSQLLTLAALSPLAAHALPKYPEHHHQCGGGKPSVSSATTTINTGIPLSIISTFSVIPIESLTKATKTYTTDYLTTVTPVTTVTTGIPLSEVPSFTQVPAESLPTTDTFSTDFLTTVTPVTTVTTGIPLTEVPSFTQVPVESLPTTASFSTDFLSATTLTTTVTTGLPLSEVPTFTEAPAASLPTSSFVTFTITASPASSGAATNRVEDGTYPEATPISYQVPATQQCGNDDRVILPGMPWTVANSMYNANQMVGSQCTNFDGILQTPDGIKEVKFTSVTNVQLVDNTKDICKGYSNVGVGVNLNQRLRDIKSIPAYYKWDRTITADFRGSNLFDFITAPTAGDTSSRATSEFMLWIHNWGNQVPIGYAQGPVATLNMFGASWKLYEGQNGSGVTVRSMLVDENYDGVFQGNLKEWLEAMVSKGYISDNDFVTVGNAGTEIFYGQSTMEATVALDINV